MKTPRASQRPPFPTPRSEGGFTLAELVILIAVIGILSVMAVPAFLRYYQAATLKSGAQQFVTLINQARELAIKENGNICVKLSSPTQMSYALNTCAGTAWVGPGTDAAGNINLPPGITAAVVGLNLPIFNYVGSALPAANFTLTNTQTGATLTVAVAASGRVTIQP